ncbi:MAG: CDP-alcohol phosphatidyltransferase family protein [Burkholderiales bacterium]|nr:CDP-alcohol phosphatidyltransferase family protein [Burkholderiales bacterium]
MLDPYATALIRRPVTAAARQLARWGLSANSITLAGFALGIFAAFLIANQLYLTGAATLFGSRLLAALDGAVARRGQPTDAGGFLDITLDFLFYASIPLAFALANPTRNALAAAVLLAAFMGTSTSFLAFAALAAKRGMSSTAYPDKSIYFLGGLTEATETLACFAAMCLWPQHFAVLAYGFAALCAVTIATRIWWGWRAFS